MTKYLNPKKYWEAARERWDRFYYSMRYDIQAIRAAERTKFAQAGLSLDDGVQKLDRALSEMGKPAFASYGGMSSIHWVLFSCISLVAEVRDVLEIGTFDGQTASLLTKIFPEAEVLTMDLPEDDPIFSGSYRRDDKEIRRKFKETQARNLENDKIHYVSKNSFFLPEVINRKYDLIWVDGGHLYPEIAWDLCNAYHACAPGGWLMCDDVITCRDGYRDAYVSPDSHSILEYIRERTNERVLYFLKRESPEWSADPRKRKFVAVLRKSRTGF